MEASDTPTLEAPLKRFQGPEERVKEQENRKESCFSEHTEPEVTETIKEERSLATEDLIHCIKNGADWTGSNGALWRVVKLYTGVVFRTSGRGKEHVGAVDFTYDLKVSSRTGLITNELVFSNRPNGKTVTRSTVELALDRALEVQRSAGFVSGPRKLGDLFGKSQLYAMFLAWGLIKSEAGASDSPF